MTESEKLKRLVLALRDPPADLTVLPGPVADAMQAALKEWQVTDAEVLARLVQDSCLAAASDEVQAVCQKYDDPRSVLSRAQRVVADLVAAGTSKAEIDTARVKVTDARTAIEVMVPPVLDGGEGVDHA